MPGCSPAPVASDGTLGTRRRLTDTATSQSYCGLGHTVVSVEGDDHVFYMQPQKFLAGGEGTHAHVVRRVFDIDAGTESDADGYGVNQGGNPSIAQAVPTGLGVVLAYRFAASAVTKVAVFDADGLDDDGSGARIYGGLASVMDAPVLAMDFATDGVEDTDGGESVAMLRAIPDGVDDAHTLEWAQVQITPGDPNVATLAVGGPTTPALLGEVEALQGSAAVIADVGGGYRAVWMADGAIQGTTTTVDGAQLGDDRMATETTALVRVAQSAGAVAYLVAVGEGEDASLHLVTSGR